MNIIVETGSVIDADLIVYIGQLEHFEIVTDFSKTQRKIVSEQLESKNGFHLNKIDKHIFLAKYSKEKEWWREIDNQRKLGASLIAIVEKYNLSSITIKCLISDIEKDYVKALLEGLLLSTYRFELYKSKTKPINLDKIVLEDEILSEDEINELQNVATAVAFAKDMVNEPVISLNAQQFAHKTKEICSKNGLIVDIKDKNWIEEQSMGGLLAVNKGSIDPPYFLILEHKPQNFTNSKPIAFVGKGVMYDTGGLSLKTSAYMETMKADMGGAAAVVGAMLCCAANNIPLWVRAYIPLTDNRPGGNAYAPGDVIKMRNGKYVEVLNTDAEGRMILADALSYAETDNPWLVIDIATLTGAAQAAVSEHAAVVMGTAIDEDFDKLELAGFEACERIVRFPFWDEYGEMIKSDIADIKNVGGPIAGAITAGKFLEHFTNYKWIHIDISGSAFLKTKASYKGIGATGFGVRLLYQFLKAKMS